MNRKPLYLIAFLLTTAACASPGRTVLTPPTPVKEAPTVVGLERRPGPFPQVEALASAVESTELVGGGQPGPAPLEVCSSISTDEACRWLMPPLLLGFKQREVAFLTSDPYSGCLDPPEEVALIIAEAPALKNARRTGLAWSQEPDQFLQQSLGPVMENLKGEGFEGTAQLVVSRHVASMGMRLYRPLATLGGPMAGWRVWVERAGDAMAVTLVEPGAGMGYVMGAFAVLPGDCRGLEEGEPCPDRELANVESASLSPDGQLLVVIVSVSDASDCGPHAYHVLSASVRGLDLQ